MAVQRLSKCRIRIHHALFILMSLPLMATAQLKEFEVREMERPDVSVVQANGQWPEDALLLIYSSLNDLNFRSSLGAIHEVSYNDNSNRYEVLCKPDKQMIFVYSDGFIERKIGTINPRPKDVFYYTVETLEVQPQLDAYAGNILQLDRKTVSMETLINNPALAFQHRDSISLISSTDELVACEITGLDNLKQALTVILDEKEKFIPLEALNHFVWSGKRFQGDFDTRSMACVDFPFIPSNENGDIIEFRKFFYSGLDSKRIYDVFKRVIQGKDLLSSKKLKWNDERRNLSLRENHTLTIEASLSAPYSVDVGIGVNVQFEPNHVSLQISVNQIGFFDAAESPKKFLSDRYLKKNGTARKTNYEVCLAINNKLSNIYRLESILGLTVSVMSRRSGEALGNIAEFEEYLFTNELQGVEGKWNVFVSLSDGQQIAAFEVGVRKSGDRFELISLSEQANDFIRPIKNLQSTADSNSLIVFGDSGSTTGIFQLESSVTAKSSITVSQSSFEALVGPDISSVSDPSRVLNYRFVKSRN